MRYLKSLALTALLLAAATAIFPPAEAQLPAPAGDAQATTDALRDISVQQKTIADNQAKIDEKLAVVAENVRLARLFVARAK